ncbi:MAG: hypothetical protein QOI59_5195 [Gammaproteobacteria bacterium]|nr:hypothetical protein [Gammaproteobacteria bacterium]
MQRVLAAATAARSRPTALRTSRSRGLVSWEERHEVVALVEKAHIVCPYSNATRGNIDVRLTVL